MWQEGFHPKQIIGDANKELYFVEDDAEFHPKQIIGDAMMVQKINYIHQNPVRRGYVERPEHWRYSSARDYMGGDGLIPLTLYHR